MFLQLPSARPAHRLGYGAAALLAGVTVFALALPHHLSTAANALLGLAVLALLIRARQQARAHATRAAELHRVMDSTLLAVGLALEARGLEAPGHTERVAGLAMKLGEALQLSPVQREWLRQGAYLHDLGKFGVPEAVLTKPAKLSSQEWQTVRTHADHGHALAARSPGLHREVLGVIRYHHERWDGRGYPVGLAGDSIPLLARIFAVCDVYDALVSERPYKVAWSREAALMEIAAQAGRQFDPQVVAAFLPLAHEAPLPQLIPSLPPAVELPLVGNAGLMN